MESSVDSGDCSTIRRLVVGNREGSRDASRGFLSSSESEKASNAVGVIVATVAPFFAALTIAMIVGNCLTWLVPPARRVMAREAEPHPGTSFRESQGQLIQLAKYLVPIGLGLGAVGAGMPWGR